jgi:hypothetical protein
MNVSLTKKTLVFICAVALIASIGLTAALNSYTQTFSWSKAVTASFVVSNSDVLDYGALDLSTPVTQSRSYVVTNDGSLPVTVEALATVTPPASASISWDKTSATITPGESETFVLTLVINDAGSCTVDFAKSP